MEKARHYGHASSEKIFHFAKSKTQIWQTNECEEFAGQFLCTFVGCGKLLSNNVSFMYHLWAHVGFFLSWNKTSNYDIEIEEDEDYEKMTDETFICMCCVCFTKFETAFDRTRHFLEVHSGRLIPYKNKSCHICESATVSSDHDSFHPVFELPYMCQKCGFRTDSRMAWLEHFRTHHFGTRFLMCPFCSYCTLLPKKTIHLKSVTAKSYVEHVTLHGKVLPKKCSRCSFTFICEKDFRKHIKDHEVKTNQHLNKGRLDNLKALALHSQRRSPSISLSMCLCCKNQFNSQTVEDHFTGKWLKCERCTFETRCKTWFWKHSFDSECDPFFLERNVLAVRKDKNFIPPKLPKEVAKKTQRAMLSKGFIQTFRLFRDFSFDRKPNPKYLKKRKSKVASDMGKMKKKIREMTSKPIPTLLLSGISKSLIAASKNQEDFTLCFSRSIRVAFSPLYGEFLQVNKTSNQM